MRQPRCGTVAAKMGRPMDVWHGLLAVSLAVIVGAWLASYPVRKRLPGLAANLRLTAGHVGRVVSGVIVVAIAAEAPEDVAALALSPDEPPTRAPRPARAAQELPLCRLRLRRGSPQQAPSLPDVRRHKLGRARLEALCRIV
jgi:hypothetical protein